MTAMELCVGEKFRLRRKLGSGSFGDVFSGRNAETGQQVAIKLELAQSKRPLLAHEAHIYSVLKGEVGIPKMHWCGVESEYNVMVMDRLGPSLQNLFDACDRKFSLKTVLIIADQMITRCEQLHAKDYLHRDIKPDNFLIGEHKNGKAGLVHMIDFGLARRFQDRRSHKHVAFGEGKSFLGTARFASVNAHHGILQSRRDDLEAVGYVLVYFLRGSLPWQGLKAESKQDLYDQISAMKASIPSAKLCEHLPVEFASYLNYCQGLNFTEKPDYFYLRGLFNNVLIRNGLLDDGLFDWISPSQNLMSDSSEHVLRLEGEFLAAAALAVC